ncbi:MAG: iron ABC transporter substrate-binding protein [Halobacteriovoraceae bacterium]|nr:iron ABC transporter substrate-binding protein [Halobacteriovoraceae bacterium]
MLKLLSPVNFFRITFLTLTLYSLTAQAAKSQKEEVNLYSYRQEFLLRPLLKAFESANNVKVNVVTMKKGLLQRLKAEGKHSPADIVLTADIGNLELLSKEGLLQKFTSKKVEENIPKAFRDPKGFWIGLSARARIIYYSKKRVNPKELLSYEDLMSNKFKGKICSRSGLHPYNISLLSSLIYHRGEAFALSWAKKVRENLARKPQGNDRSQVKAISEGLCDISLGNTYYMGKMLENPEQREWASRTGIIFPNQKTTGSHINITGVGITKSSRNIKAAKKLVEFLTGGLAQHLYAQVNHEYPLKEEVPFSGIVKSFGADQSGINNGQFKRDLKALVKLSDLRTKSIKLLNKAGFE